MTQPSCGLCEEASCSKHAFVHKLCCFENSGHYWQNKYWYGPVVTGPGSLRSWTGVAFWEVWTLDPNTLPFCSSGLSSWFYNEFWCTLLINWSQFSIWVQFTASRTQHSYWICYIFIYRSFPLKSLMKEIDAFLFFYKRFNRKSIHVRCDVPCMVHHTYVLTCAIWIFRMLLDCHLLVDYRPDQACVCSMVAPISVNIAWLTLQLANISGTDVNTLSAELACGSRSNVLTCQLRL